MIKPALIALALLATPASATVLLQSDATSINASQAITFDFIFDPPVQQIFPGPINPDGSQDFVEFIGGTATFQSGDGQFRNVHVGPGGSTNVSFTYAAPGDFIASVSGQALYQTVHFFTPTSWFFLPNTVGESPSFTFTAFEAITVAAVPEPATWALLLFGFGFFAIKGIWPGKSHG